MPRLRMSLLLCLAFGLSTVGARALPQEQRFDRTEAPRFDVPAGAPLALESAVVHADVSDIVAHVTVTQTYVNRGDAAIDATYVFPLSTRAAVTGMTMELGTRRIVAEIREKAQAEAIFTAAKEAGKTASLLTQQRSNVFTTDVANIRAKERVVVRLTYLELIVPTDRTYQVVIPAAVGPRYVATGPEDARWAAAAGVGLGDAKWSVTVDLAAGVPVRAVRSSTHTLQVTPRADGTVAVAMGQPLLLPSDDPDRVPDFVLSYRLSSDAVHAGVLRHVDGDGGYFLAMIHPPERLAPEVIVPREYLFIVDVSSSMDGFPIATSKALVMNLVAQLRPTDRFNILTFAGGQDVLAEAPLPATPANRARATAFLASQRANGGTELLPALKMAMAMPAGDGARAFVIATDGFVTVEEEAYDLVRENLGRASFFTFGIGTNVNRSLIESLARAGRAESYVVASAEEADGAARRFQHYIEAPVLTQVMASIAGLEVYDVMPAAAALPDLYAERPVVWLGRFRGRGPGTLTLSGRTPDGPWSETIRLDAAPATSRHPALATLWARERIARLSDGVTNGSDKADVTALGLAYHLMTPYTSFVAVDNERPNAPPRVVAMSVSDEDGDGVADTEDLCPWDPSNACRARAILTSTKAQILDRVVFEFGKFALGRAALQLLDEIVAVLSENPQLILVEIQGHSDTSEGDAKRRATLATRRAEAVRAYLIAHGVAAERLVAKGYADTKPLDSNKTRAGRERNRRVEFVILDPP